MATVSRQRTGVFALAGDAGGEPDRGRLIIDAAYDLLEEDGLEGLTIRAVLKRTGLARRAFYERFAGKDDLVLAVFEQALKSAAQHFRHQAATLADPLQKIRQIVVGLVTRVGLESPTDRQLSDRRSAALSREHLRLADSRPAELQSSLSPLLDLIAELVAEGIARGQIRDCDPALHAALIYNLVSTTVHTEVLAEEGGEQDQDRRTKLAEDIWEFVRRAIAA